MPADPPALALRDPARGDRNLAALAAHLGAKRFAALRTPLERLLPGTADPDMALNHLERLLAHPAAQTRLPDLLAAGARGLDAVLHLLATSQFFADTLAADPDALALVLDPPARTPAAADLARDLRGARAA